MRRALGLAVVLALVTTPAWAAVTSTASASLTVASATLDAPGGMHCTSTTGIATPITFVWTKPTALTGKATGPLSYSIRRRGNAGAWTTIATGVTVLNYSDNPSALLPLGTVWDYQVEAVYGSWTSPWSTSISGVYGTVIITVLLTCAP